MSKVYVIQQQFFIDQKTGRTQPRFNTLNLVEKYGEVVEVLSPQSTPFKSIVVIEDIHRNLGGINSKDFILPIGNCTLVSWAVSIASNYLQGKIKILQWSVRDEEYVPMELDLF